MYLFHHKTKHWYFVVFIPVIMAVQIMAAILKSEKTENEGE